MRLAVAHDWFVSYAGSERVVEQILQVYPESRLLTTIVAPDRLPAALRSAEPSFLQRIPGAVDHHEWFLPAMPLAWAVRAPVNGIDAVVSSSHACAKAVPIAPGIPHLCYCHTPMRYAWDFESERQRFPRVIRPVARMMMGWFRGWDRATAERVDVFVANSTAVAERIARCYGRRSQVIFPPVDTNRFKPGGERGDAFLYVGRLVGYKRPDLVVEAFAGLKERLIVVGDGHLLPSLRARGTRNITFLGHVDQETLLDLYRRAKALVFPAEEDFGIAMAEAQACGTPVIALARGGATDIIDDGETGWLLKEPTVGEIDLAVRRVARESLDTVEIRRRAERFAIPRFRDEFRAAIETMVERFGRAGGRSQPDGRTR